MLLVATTLGAADIGGGETFLRGLIGGLTQRGAVELGVVLLRSVVENGAALPASAELIPIEGKPGPLRFLKDMANVGTIGRSWNASVVHYPHEWTPRSERPVVITIQNIGFLHPDSRREIGLRGQALRLASKRTARRAAAVGAVSQVARDLWVADTRYRGPTTIIREGFDAPPAIASPTPIKPYVLCTGGRFTYKQTALAIEAFLRSDAVKSGMELLVAGVSAPLSSTVPPNVRYLGWVSRSELFALMEGSDAVVMPSAVESFGLTALEALCAGAPTVVCCGTGAAEWLSDHAVVCHASVGPMSEGINRAVSGKRPPASEVMGQFDWADIAGEWESLYLRAARAFP